MDNAELYLKYNTFQKKSATNLLKEFSNRLSWVENETVLDIGCGPGDVSTQVLLPQLPKDVSQLVSGHVRYLTLDKWQCQTFRTW